MLYLVAMNAMKKISSLLLGLSGLTSLCLFCLSMGFASRANAGIAHTLGDAAPVIGEGEFSGRLVGDILLSDGGGLNITPRIKTGLWDQYVDITGVIGAGRTDWQVGAVVKYNLLPDVAGQVGLSFLGSVHLLKLASTAFQFGGGMVVSKKMQAGFGKITPFGSLELDFVFVSRDSYVPVHLNAGAIWEPTSTGPWSFTTELQCGLANGYYALGLGTAYRF